MTKASSYVLGYAAERERFSCSELMDSTDSISRTSLNWALVQLESRGELARISHGVYAKSSKQKFNYSPSEDIKLLFESLKQNILLLISASMEEISSNRYSIIYPTMP